MKKIGIMYSLLALIVALGVWADWPRKTEAFEASFDAKELPEYRIRIEENWKKSHPNAKNVSFAYYSSHGKIVGYWVNYY